MALALTVAPAVQAASHPLTYSQAKKAAQTRGRKIAHKPVKVSSLFRQSAHSYFAQVKWDQTDPHGCKSCGYDPDTDTFYDTPTTEYCFADMKVRRSARTGRITTVLQDKSCN